MNPTTTVILNPYAGRWQGQRLRATVEQQLHEAGVAYALEVTERPGQAVELARRAVEGGAGLVVAAGGDGTVCEVVNGLCAVAGAPARLGVLPIGTGNDLATMVGVPQDLPGACRALAAGQTRALDVGRVTWDDGAWYFDNNSGLGLEATVSLENDRLVRLKGKVRYIVAALREIARTRPWQIALEWEGGRYEGPAVLVSIGNTRRNGGSFYMHPRAEPDDGQFDFLYGHTPSRLRLLQLLPMAMKGTHVNEPEITTGRSPRLSVRFDPPTPIQCDGEVVAQAAREIHYEILPARLQVVVASPGNASA